MSEQSNKDLVTNLLAAVYPEGLTAAAIGKQLEALDPRQRSNALYNLKRDGVITLDAETKEYQLRTAPKGYTQHLVKQAASGAEPAKPVTQAPKKPPVPWPAPARSVNDIVAPRVATSPEIKETKSPSALHARVRMAMLKMEHQLNQKQPKPIENLDLKIEVLNDLHRLLDPCIKPLLADIINDLKQREQEAAA